MTIDFVSLQKASFKGLLVLLRSSQDIRLESYEQISFIEKKTIRAMVAEVYFFYQCQSCGLRPISYNQVLEGHHVTQKKMYISDYKHCITSKARVCALQRLHNELLHRSVPLCKTCHENIHHTK